jgi:flagellar motility protein MotE (MotC chaperone)
MTAGTARKTSRRPDRRSRRGALFFIAVLLASSGLLRLGLGVGHALANAEETDTAVSEAPQTCEPDGGALAMLEDLRAREERLLRQEEKAADLQQALALAKTEIDAKLAALVTAEERLASTLTLADEAADKDVTRLIAVYEKMKPKDAAQVFGEMAPDFAAGFLARMKPEAAAAVMAGLEPQKAYTISVLLAGRNAAAPRE